MFSCLYVTIACNCLLSAASHICWRCWCFVQICRLRQFIMPQFPLPAALSLAPRNPTAIRYTWLLSSALDPAIAPRRPRMMTTALHRMGLYHRLTLSLTRAAQRLNRGDNNGAYGISCWVRIRWLLSSARRSWVERWDCETIRRPGERTDIALGHCGTPVCHHLVLRSVSILQANKGLH